MGRRLLVADFAGGVRVGVVQLESLANPDRRREQLATAFAVVKEAPRSVLLGDFNFPDGAPETVALDPEFTDAWPSLFAGDPGYTRDTVVNRMARFGRQEKQQRLDRILFRGLRPQSLEMLGREPIGPDLYPSDHFGLLARFTTS